MGLIIGAQAVSLARLDRIGDADVLQLTCRGAQYISDSSECLSCTGPGPNDGHWFNRIANSCQPCTDVAGRFVNGSGFCVRQLRHYVWTM